MKMTIPKRLSSIALGGLLMMASPTFAEVHSKTHTIIVVQPKDLPEQARAQGNSLFLYSDGKGSTYLYVEQQQGARLSVFDVTDPSNIKVVASVAVSGPGAFDFVRPLDGRGELVRFRENKSVAVLDLHNVKVPTLRMIQGLSEGGETESLGETAFLMVNEPYNYIRETPRDYQVIDSSTPSEPVLLATVAQVKHKLINRETGTTFLLGSDGLTVIRRTDVEYDYKVHQMQMKQQ
jgi:hypothetical protein